MPDFLRVALADGSVAVFEAAESDLVSLHSGRADVEEATAATVGQLEMVARTAGVMAATMRERLSPTETTLEVALGLSGEVGWFFAKSSVSGSVKLTLKWKASPTAGGAAGAAAGE